MKTKSFLVLCIVLMRISVIAQVKIGNNSTTINTASLLELETTNKGLVLPRVSITSISSSAPLAAGLLTGTVVYNTNSTTTGGSGVGIYYWDGSQWNFIANTTTTASYWSLNGNGGTNAASNFIGTTDAIDFIAKTNNAERMRILGSNGSGSKAGWIGMGISLPRSSLDVTGDYTNKNVLTLQNTSSTGFTSIDMLDNTGGLKGTFGYANTGTGGSFGGRTYFNSYGSDMLFTANSGTYHLFLQGGTGYIGINTSTPTERLHVVGNIYLSGAFMPGGDAGTSGFVLTSAGTGTAPTWNRITNTAWGLTGNANTSYATNFLGTTDNVSMRFRTNNVQRMIIDSVGKVGIGLNNPSYALSVLSASNPLYLSGLQSTSSFSLDSVLTINAGIVKKTPYSSLISVGINVNNWSLTGNSGTSPLINYLGTADNVSMRFRTNSIQRMIIDSIGRIGVGISNPSYALSVLSASNPLYLSGLQATSTFASDSILTINAGIVKKAPYSALAVTTTNTLSLSSNTLTSTVNGISATSNAVSSINNTSSVNTLSTTVNGVTGTTVPIINTNTNALTQTGGLITTVNGVAATTSIANGTVSNILGFNTSGTPVYQTASSLLSGSTTNALDLSGNLLTSTVNGVTDTSKSVSSVNNTSSSNNLSTTINGITGTTVPIINTNTNAFTQTGGLVTTVNGVAAATSIANGTISKLLGFSSTGTPVYQSPGSLADSVQDYDWRKAGNLNPSAPADTINNIYHISGNVGIGTSSPAAPLHISTSSSPGMLVDRISANNNAVAVVLRKARDLTSAGGVQTTDILGLYTAAGSYGNGLYGSLFNSGIAIRATENWTSTAQGSELLFRNTANGANAFNYNMGINQNGNVNIAADAGTTTPYAKLHVNAAGVSSAMTAMNGDGIALTGNHFYFENPASINGQRVFSFANAGGVLTINANTNDASTTAPSTSLPGAIALKASNGYIGINTNNPTNQLHVVSTTDPLRLVGLQAGTSVDSVLTINNGGVVKYRLFSDIGNDNFWNLTGNSGTNYATNFLGTTDNLSMRFRTKNIERMVIDSLGSVGIGSTNFDPYLKEKFLVDYGNTTSNNIASFKGSINDYLQIGVQNKSNGINASSDVVATADDGTDSTYYIDMGINSSTYAPSFENFGGPHDGYLYTYSRNLIIGAQKASSDIIFLTGGGVTRTNSVLRLDGATGNIIVGKGENYTTAVGNTIRATNGGGTNVPGGSLALQGGSATGNALGGNLNLYGGGTTSGTTGSVNINTSTNSATNINTGTSASNITMGGNANNILLPKFTTVGGLYYTSVNTGQVSTTGSNMTWDSINNRMGIGISNPGYKLSVLSSSNPLYLSGVQATSTFSTDSILTINAGIVKKAPYSSLSADWSLVGNAGTTAGTNFIGTTDATDFVTKTNNLERIRVTGGGLVGIGTNAPASDLTIFQSSGSGSTKGFTFTGNSIGGTNSGTGFLISLGYNTNGNKQLWLGDADYAGNAAGSFGRFVVSGTNFPVFDAVSGDNALRRYIALGVAGDANSGVIFGTDNTGVKPGSQVWDNGNMTIGSGYKSNMAPSNGLLVQGNVGIGIASPSSALSVLAASNPLYLSGVQATSTFSTDSILTINAGIVKKAPYSSLPSGGSSGSSGWALTGNSGTNAGTNFLGTTDAQPLIIKSLGRQLAYFDGNLYNVALGNGASAGTSDHNVAIGFNSSTTSQYAMALGYSASASAAQSTALGYSATASNQYALALGYQAVASGVRSIALGNGGSATTASGAESIAIGYNANANNVQTAAVGYQAQATGQYGLALGYNPTASGSQSTAIGYQALASAQYSNAIGYQAQVSGTQSTAIGYLAQTTQSNTILLGNIGTPNLYVGIGTANPSAKLHIAGNASGGYNPLQITGLPAGSSGDNILSINSTGVVGSVTASVIVGSAAWSLNGNAATSSNFLGTTNTTPLQFKFNNTLASYLDANNTSFGTSSIATTAGTNNTAIGYSATASNNATAIGANAVANQANNTAIGNSALANTSAQTTAIGASSQALYVNNIAVGYSAQATISNQETVVGSFAQAQGQNNISIGYSAKANGSDKITVVGSNAQGSFQNNTVVGYSAQATTNNQATAIGATAAAQAQNATSLGYAASAAGVNSTAIGEGASATATNSTAIGYNSSATAVNALVLGNSSTNVGIGTSTPNTGTKLDVNGSFKMGSSGSVLSNFIKTTVTINPGSMLAGSTVTTTSTITGAATGNSVIINPRSALPTGVLIAYCYISAANTLTVVFTSAVAADPPSTVFDITLIQ